MSISNDKGWSKAIDQISWVIAVKKFSENNPEEFKAMLEKYYALPAEL